MRVILKFLKNPFLWYKKRQAEKKRLEAVRKRDPFVYK